MALRLRDLSFIPLGTEQGYVETAYSTEGPPGNNDASIVGVQDSAVMLAAAAISSLLILLVVPSLATASLGLWLFVVFFSALAAAKFSLHCLTTWRSSRAVVARAVAEVQPHGVIAAFRAASAWTLADVYSVGRMRGFARRGSHVVLIEASFVGSAIAPIEAFVLQPRNTQCRKGLKVHAYTFPSSLRTPTEAAATTASRLQEFLAACDSVPTQSAVPQIPCLIPF